MTPLHTQLSIFLSMGLCPEIRRIGMPQATGVLATVQPHPSRYRRNTQLPMGLVRDCDGDRDSRLILNRVFFEPRSATSSLRQTTLKTLQPVATDGGMDDLDDQANHPRASIHKCNHPIKTNWARCYPMQARQMEKGLAREASPPKTVIGRCRPENWHPQDRGTNHLPRSITDGHPSGPTNHLMETRLRTLFVSHGVAQLTTHFLRTTR